MPRCSGRVSLSERKGSLAPPLAHDPDAGWIPAIVVAERQGGQLADAQPAGVRQMKHGSIAYPVPFGSGRELGAAP